MVKRAWSCCVVAVFLLLYAYPVAAADYMLPYPGYMPGNKLYKISRLLDGAKAFWNWGNIASARYHLGLADKYLVEAKTLYEYKQYLLATSALGRSDREIELVPTYLAAAKKEGKDIRRLENTFKAALAVHISLLKALEVSLPEEVLWSPEKQSAVPLHIVIDIKRAQQIRTEVASGL